MSLHRKAYFEGNTCSLIAPADAAICADFDVICYCAGLLGDVGGTAPQGGGGVDFILCLAALARWEGTGWARGSEPA